MKRADLKKFITDNKLLTTIPAFGAGIYAITIDDYIVYIGESKKLVDRCSNHIYNIENAMLMDEKKYKLLLAAKLGGHKVDCKVLEVCDEADRFVRERYYLEQYKPLLNINIPGEKRHNLDGLRIEDLLDGRVYQVISENSDKIA